MRRWSRYMTRVKAAAGRLGIAPISSRSLTAMSGIFQVTLVADFWCK